MKNHNKILVKSIFILLLVFSCSNESTDVNNNTNNQLTFNETLPANLTVECDNIPLADILTSSDNCENTIVPLIEITNGEQDECPSEFSINRTWMITDCDGNTFSHTQIITVQDTTAPIFNEELPLDKTVEFNNVPVAMTITASDNCDININVLFNETIEGDNDTTPNEYEIKRTWDATDCSGNTISHTQNITVEDNSSVDFNFLNFMSDGDDSVTVTYSDGLLTGFDDQGAAYTFTYNSDNKLSTAVNQHGEVLSFTYVGGKIDKIIYSYTDGSLSWEDQFNYDSGGRIESIIENKNDGYDQSDYYAYDASGILESRQIGQSGSVYSFEFDDMLNPFYPIWETFGFLIDLEDSIYDILPMFIQHNPTKILRNGEVILEATYTYDTDGYPSSANFTNSGGTGSVNYQYQN